MGDPIEDGVTTNVAIRRLTRMIAAQCRLDVVVAALQEAEERWLVLADREVPVAELAQKTSGSIRKMRAEVCAMRDALSDVCESHARSMVGPFYHVLEILATRADGSSAESLWRVVGPGGVNIATFTEIQDAGDYRDKLNARAREARK